MDGDILDAVTEWGTRPVADGVAGLYDLADGSFSGAVTDGTAWAFVLNGRFVGVFDGGIEDFEDASLTAHTAPDMSLPLLYAMQARGGEIRGQYYSNETPLSEIDETLSSGNFVGYVELSENVLSGDYYVVYYGGRSLPVAYVGNSRRLLTGDEAFERAADEVGIYSVVEAGIEVVDLPERPEPEPDPEPDPDPDTDETGVAIVGDADDADPSTDATVDDEPEPEPEADADADAAVADAADDGGADAFGDDTVGDGESGGAEVPEADETATEPGAASTATSMAADEAVAFDEAVDSASADADGEGDADAASVREADAASPTRDAPDPSATPNEEVERLRRQLAAAREAKAEAEAARDRAEDERDELRAEVDRLRDRVAELEAEIGRLDADADATPERTLPPDEALAGTNLFVRYEDKADGTLERAAEGRISAEELRANLRLNYHTEFETAGLQVDGRPFEAFLRDTTEHRFAEWLLTELTPEIRRTDTRAELTKLYEAIERIDRIDLDGAVTVDPDEEGAAATDVSFDVVFRDKMGDALFVASFDDSRDPTPAGTIRSLLDRTQSVSEASPSFAAAFVVTTSFFDADAMEVAVDATRGGLFSRSSRRSYVKLSRKSGFHLCLVEARDEDFFVTVPEL